MKKKRRKRNMKKKLVSVLLCVAMVASMAVGCGSKSDSKSKESDSDGKTTLTFWCHENEPWVKSYKAMAEKFEKENPEYTVEVKDYPFKVYNDKRIEIEWNFADELVKYVEQVQKICS